MMSAIGRTGITALSPSPAARVRHVKLLEVPAFDLALHEDPTDRFISVKIGRTGTWEPLDTESFSPAVAAITALFIDPAQPIVAG